MGAVMDEVMDEVMDCDMDTRQIYFGRNLMRIVE